MKNSFSLLFTVLVFILGYSTLMNLKSKSSPLDLQKKQFFVRKFNDPKKFDCIIAGDSRVYRGIDPKILTQKIEKDCFNIGFDSAGFGESFFELIEKKIQLKKDSYLFLGITPHSFTEQAAINNQLQEYLKLSSYESEHILHPTFFSHLFPVISLNFLKEQTLQIEQSKANLNETYFENGFAPAFFSINNPNAATDSYRNIFKEHLYSLKIESLFLEKLKMLTGKYSIKVFIFRIPTSPSIREVENQYSKFDESLLKEKIISTGAHWISFPERSYETFDGSHITEKESKNVTEIISDSIKKQ